MNNGEIWITEKKEGLQGNPNRVHKSSKLHFTLHKPKEVFLSKNMEK